MTFVEIMLGFGLVLGACVLVVAYLSTDRGSDLWHTRRIGGRTIYWWMSRSWWKRHWPFVFLIIGYTLGYGFVMVLLLR